MANHTNALAGARRTRRNLVKGAALVAGALLAVPVAGRPAAARRHWGGGCFLRGTQIRTASGHRKIEKLAVGDVVVARFGGMSPIKAIGRYTVRKDAADARWPDEVRPVRVKRSALDEGVPGTDLYLTPSHALFIDDVLVPVGDLVNDTTIAFDDFKDRSSLEYFHIELEDHDVIDAEGVACETLLGDAKSGIEATADRDGPAASRKPCAPLLTFNGGRNELKSRLRSAAAVVIDRRESLDRIRDALEERGLALAGR